MRSLWRDVREHRAAAALLLVWWIALLAGFIYLSLYSWANSGHSAPVVSDLVISSPAFPFVAAIVAGWWRATALKSGSWVGPSALSGLLVGQISCVAFVLCIWGFFYLIGPLVPTSDYSSFPPSEWIIAGVVIFFVLGSVIGALGGLVGGVAAWANGRAPSDGKSVERMSSR